MSATEKQGLISGDQNGAGGGLGHDPGTIRGGAMPEECGAVAVRAAARGAFPEVMQGIGAEEGGQEVAQLIFEENWYRLPVEEEDEEEVEEDEEEVEEEAEEEDEEDEDDKEEGEEMEEGQEEDGEEGKDEEEEEEDEKYEDEEDKEEEEEVSSEEDDKNYADREEEEDGKEGTEIVAGIYEFPMAQFRSLFWGLSPSSLYHL